MRTFNSLDEYEKWQRETDEREAKAVNSYERHMLRKVPERRERVWLLFWAIVCIGTAIVIAALGFFSHWPKAH